jgi:hypothetical protein
MPDFNVRSDSVNVEQIMEQIRARIRDKRGVDYTEQQIRELAAVKLEKFLDPRGVRSDLLEQFRKAQPAYAPPELPNYAFESHTIYDSTRAPLRWIRKLLNPILKLFFNPNPFIQALNIQSRLNTMYGEREARREATRRAFDQLQYELMHNLVIETTRMSIEVKNLKMRVESLSSRLEFNERRARALESVVVYKPSGDERIPPPPPQPPAVRDNRAEGMRTVADAAPASPSPSFQNQPSASQGGGQSQPGAMGPSGEGPGQRSRRRRRRRGRRGGGGPAVAIMSQGGGSPASQPPRADVAPAESQAAQTPASPASASADQSAPSSPPSAPDDLPSTPDQ